MKVSALLALLASIVPCYSLASNPSNSKMELSYFNLRGAAESARILLALGKMEYEDVRFDLTPGKMESPAFNEAKENGVLKMNLNRAPILKTEEGVVIGQSKAIERYLARRLGLMGSNDTEEALVDCIAEHCRDVRDAQMRKRFSAFVKDRSDEEKEESRKEWFDEEMPAMLVKINDVVKETGTPGFAVGEKSSLADVAIFSLLRDCYDLEDTTEAAKSCEALNAIADTIANDPNVSKWLESRPATFF